MLAGLILHGEQLLVALALAGVIVVIGVPIRNMTQRTRQLTRLLKYFEGFYHSSLKRRELAGNHGVYDFLQVLL